MELHYHGVRSATGARASPHACFGAWVLGCSLLGAPDRLPSPGSAPPLLLQWRCRTAPALLLAALLLQCACSGGAALGRTGS